MEHLKSSLELNVTVGSDASPNSPDVFAKSEVERSRRFEYGNVNVNNIGALEDMRLLVKYDKAGSGSCQIDYVENVKHNRITSGVTRIGLVDINGVVIAIWDHPLFRDCGRHPRSFSAAIARNIAESVTGLHFETVGSVNAQRC